MKFQKFQTAHCMDINIIYNAQTLQTLVHKTIFMLSIYAKQRTAFKIIELRVIHKPR